MGGLLVDCFDHGHRQRLHGWKKFSPRAVGNLVDKLVVPSYAAEIQAAA